MRTHRPRRDLRGSRAPARGPWVLLLAAALLGVCTPLERVVAQGALSAMEAEVDGIATRARPSMLTIIAQRYMPVARGSAPGTPRRMHSRVGSGVAVGKDLVLTTSSVLLGADRIVVLTDNKLQVEAEVAGIDPIFNVALLRVSGLQLPALKLAARKPQPGDWVIVLGSSYGAEPTTSVGNVARRWKEPRTSLLQLTNAVYPGNSGGAAINTQGELVGLVQGELGAPEATGRGKDSERRPSGMSFVIPSEDIVPVFDAFQKEGRFRHGFFGVSTRNVFVDSDTEKGMRVPLGAMVESVAQGGPAARLGLVKGDLIVAFDGERVQYSEQLARWVAATRPGTVVNIVWAHDELQRSGKVALGESPSVIPEWMQTGAPETASNTRAKGSGDPVR